MSLQQIVSTVLTAAGGPAFISTLASIGRAADSTANRVAAVPSALLPIQPLIAAAVGAVSLHKVTALGSAFEDTQNKIAGFFTALGQAPNFESGLQLAETTMRRIETVAARLPGEAEDYVRVFSQSLPQVQKAVGGSLEQMLTFTNRMTAIGSTFKIDSMQIAHDLQRMLQVGRGGAGLDVRTFTEMLPFLQQVKGFEDLNTDKFNAMTNVKRADLLQKAMAGLQPMIDRASNTWGAVQGAVASTARTLTRLGTEPVFDAMKSAMNAAAGSFFDADGAATQLGTTVIAVSRTVSTGLVAGVREVVRSVSWIAQNGESLLGAVFGGRIEALQQMAQYAQMGGAAGGPSAAIASTVDNLVAAIGPVSTFAAQLWNTLQMVNGAVEGVALIVLPAFSAAIYTILQPLAAFYSAAYGVVQGIVESVMPHLAVLAAGIGDLVRGIADFISPLITILGGAVTWLLQQVKDYLLPAVNFVVWLLGKLASAIGSVLSAIGQETNRFLGKQTQAAPAKTADTVQSWIQTVMESIQREKDKMREAAQSSSGGVAASSMRKAPNVRSGTTVNQDFRFSRFSIEQRFAEGWDPDRIAVAFAKDVASKTTQKLQSGFEPLFGIR